MKIHHQIYHLTPRFPRLNRTRSLKNGPKANKTALSTAQVKSTDVDIKSFKFPISADIRERPKKANKARFTFLIFV